jgi:hypothetical protein
MAVSPDWVVSARVRSLFLIWSLLMALVFGHVGLVFILCLALIGL